MQVGVDLRRSESRFDRTSPLEQFVNKIAPAVEHCEVGADKLHLYGPDNKNVIVIGLDKTFAYFEHAWAQGCLDELLPEDIANQAGLMALTSKLSDLSLAREREDGPRLRVVREVGLTL